MTGVVVRHSLRQVRRTMAVLALASGAFYYLVLLSSSSFLSEGTHQQFLRNPPRAVEAFLGGSADFFQPSGWLAAAMTHPITLALLVGAALSVAAGSVATEVERGTIDLVLARPVGRTRLLTAKAAAAAIAVTTTEAAGVVGVLVARATIDRVDELSLSQVLRAFLGSWVLFVALAMVGLLVSARSSLRGRAIGISTGVIVAWFFANFIALLIDGVHGMRYASAFHYFRPTDLIAGEPAATDLGVLAALAGVALAGAVWWFARRDLTR